MEQPTVAGSIEIGGRTGHVEQVEDVADGGIASQAAPARQDDVGAERAVGRGAVSPGRAEHELDADDDMALQAGVLVVARVGRKPLRCGSDAGACVHAAQRDREHLGPEAAKHVARLRDVLHHVEPVVVVGRGVGRGPVASVAGLDGGVREACAAVQDADHDAAAASMNPRVGDVGPIEVPVAREVAGAGI